MRSKEAIRRAQNKYDKSMLKRITIKLHNVHDEDIVKHLENKDNVTEYIKKLIVADMYSSIVTDKRETKTEALAYVLGSCFLQKKAQVKTFRFNLRSYVAGDGKVEQQLL